MYGAKFSVHRAKGTVVDGGRLWWMVVDGGGWWWTVVDSGGQW